MKRDQRGIRWGKDNNTGFYWWPSEGRYIFIRPRFHFHKYGINIQILCFSFDWSIWD